MVACVRSQQRTQFASEIIIRPWQPGKINYQPVLDKRWLKKTLAMRSNRAKKSVLSSARRNCKTYLTARKGPNLDLNMNTFFDKNITSNDLMNLTFVCLSIHFITSPGAYFGSKHAQDLAFYFSER